MSSLPEKIMIDSSSVEIGVYIFTPSKQIALSTEFITLPLDTGRKETLLLSLSFKHITKVEFLDNSEGEGAGLVLFVNDFMARKIQNCIDQGGTGFLNFSLESYTNNTNNKLILLDIQNKEPELLHRIHETLQEAYAFHRNYVIQQMNKTKKIYFIPISFIDVISSSQWKTLNKLLVSARLDFERQKTKIMVEVSRTDNDNENGVGLQHILASSTFSTVSNFSHVPVDCYSVPVGQINQLPAYTVMTVPVLPQQPDMVTVRVTQPSPFKTVTTHHPSSAPPVASTACNHSPQPLFAVPSHRPQFSAAMPIVSSSQSSPTLSMPKLLTINRKSIDLPRQLKHEHQLYEQHQKKNIHKTDPTAANETAAVVRYLALELPTTANNFMPRSLQLPKAQSNAVNSQNLTNAAPPFLAVQMTSPSTSQDHQPLQLLPQSQNSSAKSETGESERLSKREREVHLIDDEENEPEPSDKRSNDTLFSFPPTGKDSCSVHFADLKYLSRNFMLNDTIIDFYLKYIHHCIVPQERKAKIFIFNSFFFGRLTQPPLGGKPSNTVTSATKIRRVVSNFQKVKNWTKKVNLFDMDYIIVPINEDIHWYLAIVVNARHGICSIGENESIFATQNRRPPVPHLIVLNSLIDPAEDKHLAVRDQLGEYLHLEYADKNSQESKTFFNKQTMEVVVPTMLPQQKNFIDCGLFLLHFAQLFLSNPPKCISKHSSFRRWYPNFEIKHKRDELRSVIRQLASHVKASDFVQLPTPRRKIKNVGRRSQEEKMQMILDGMALMGRTRRYSDSELDGIMKDEHFSCLYRPRSLDSLVYENREKPVVLQPPTIGEMSRFKQPRRVRQEIFASPMR